MKNKYTLLLFFAAFCCMGVQCKEKEEEKGPVLAEELAKHPKKPQVVTIPLAAF